MDRQSLLAPLREPTSALRNLLRAYFNQDWGDEGETWQDVVATFVAGSRPGRPEKAVSDLDRLLRSGADEEDLAWLLSEGLRSGFVPSRIGMGSREALEAMRDELQRQIEGPAGGQR